MSEFTKVYKKWHAENNGKYDSAREYHKELMHNFKGWQPPKRIVVVPQIMADFIEVRKKSLKLYDAFQEIEECHGGDLYNFVCQKRNGQDLFARAWLGGYTVEKEKLYYLKNKNTGHILYRHPKEAGGNLIEVVATINEECTWFTQGEIDTMHIGSYEQIPVEMSDNGI